jgi:neutral ceramidase
MAAIVLLMSNGICQSQIKGSFPLKVGAARIEITPNPVQAPATGEYDHEHGYIRVIVLDNSVTRAALISCEARPDQLIRDELLELLPTELNCPIENIIMSVTHCHSLRRPQNSAEINITDSLSKAIKLSITNLQPARMGFGRGMSYLNVNRDAIDPDTRKWTQAANLEGFSDKSVDVIKFETLTGEPIAAYMVYAMHPVNGYLLDVFSADFPGALCRHVEKAFGDKMVMAFNQGTVGDQNPLYTRASTNAMATRAGEKVTGYELNREHMEGTIGRKYLINNPLADAKELDNLFRFIESEGQILGEEVIRIMTVTKRMTSNVPIKGQIKVVTCPGRIRTNGSPWDQATRAGIAGEYKDGPNKSFEIAFLGLGNIALTAVAGEIFTYIGMRIKKESPLTNTMVINYTISLKGVKPDGYIPNDAAYAEQTFQVLNTYIKQGCAEESIVNGLVDMIDDYLNKK